jgi:xanthine dehydrogenase accessory factor
VILTIERFDASDVNWIAPLAAAERLGPITTTATNDGARLIRHMTSEAGASSKTATAYAKLADGRVLERFGDDLTALYLFGAGHVGRALVLALAQLPFSVTWTDPRPDAFPQHVPGNVTCVAEHEPTHVLERAPDGAFVVVITHSHALDLNVVAAALTSGRFPYIGLIGSDTKRARFVSTMSRAGIAQDAIDRLICPIGLTEIGDKSPAAIAASIAAQLLIMREQVARHEAEGEHTSGRQSSTA